MNMEYMIYDASYHHMKDDGESINNIDKAIKRYLNLVGKDMNYDEILRCCQQHNVFTLLSKICKKFEELHGLPMNTIELINRYQNGICITACTNLSHLAIYVDKLFEATIISFFLNSFLWSEFWDEIEIWKMCFGITLNCFHEQCIFGEWSSDNEIDNLIKTITDKDIHLLDLASDCYWTSMAFVLAHELSHIYFKKLRIINGTEKRERSAKDYRQEEYDADRFAYDLVLKMIEEDTKCPKEERVLYAHSCMAPMMLLDFFDIFYFTDRVLYKYRICDWKHPEPYRRKRQLFGILYNEEYQITLDDSYALYQNFLKVMYTGYKENLLLKMERGKLKEYLKYQDRLKKYRREVMNNIEEIAMNADKEMEKYIQKCGIQLGLDKKYINYIAQYSVVFVTKSETPNLIYNYNNKTMSLKPGNLFIDLKGTLSAVFEIFRCYQNPKDIFSMIQLLFLIIFSIKNVVNVTLPEGTDIVITILYKNNAFIKTINEEDLYKMVNMVQNTEKELNKKQFSGIIDFLDFYQVIECNEGNILLKEKIFGKDFI